MSTPSEQLLCWVMDAANNTSYDRSSVSDEAGTKMIDAVRPAFPFTMSQILMTADPSTRHRHKQRAEGLLKPLLPNAGDQLHLAL